MGLRTWLGLKKRTGAGRTLKRWPAELADNCDEQIVTFGVPLKSARTSMDWDQTQALLGATLRSVFGQSDPRWRILICGHEMPDIPEIKDPRVEFIASKFRPPPRPRPGRMGHSREDKYQKRMAMGWRISEFGAGYYMDLDADDLVHRDLVATALATRHGCVITTGYISDASTNSIAPVPGVVSVDFDRICGSMAVVRYEPRDLPAPRGGDMRSSQFAWAANHGYLRGRREEIGRPLEVVPFPAAIYVINSGENMSFVDIRQEEAASHLISSVRTHAITEPGMLREIARQFGWTAPRFDSPVGSE